MIIDYLEDRVTWYNNLSLVFPYATLKFDILQFCVQLKIFLNYKLYENQRMRLSILFLSIFMPLLLVNTLEKYKTMLIDRLD